MQRAKLAAIGLTLVLWLMVQPAAAQILVGTVRSANDVIDAVKYFATLVGREDIARQFEPFIDTLAGGKGLAGLERKVPFGLFMQSLPAPRQQPSFILFVPVSNEDAFLELLQALNAQVDKPNDAGLRAVTLATGQTVYLRFAHGHAFFSTEQNSLTRPLPDPKQLVPQQHRQHLIYLTLRTREIPPAARKKLLALLQQVTKLPIERKPDETEARYQVRRYLTQLAGEELLQLAQDLDALTLWADLDKTNHQLSVVLDVSVRPGSVSGNVFQRFNQVPSQLAGLQPQQGSWLHLAFPTQGPLRVLLDQVAAQMEKGIAEKPQEQQAILRKLYEGIVPTLKAETLEIAIALHGPTADGKLTPVVALRLVEGAKLEAALRELVRVLPEDAKSRIQLDTTKLAGRSVHSVLISPDDPNFTQLFGEEKLWVVLTNDYLLLSAGSHAQNILKQAVNAADSQKVGPSISLEISLRQLGILAQTSPDGKRFHQAVQRTFRGQDETRDRLRITQESQPNHLRIRVEIPTLLVRVAAQANQ
ncbi:hypothetical protein HRbin36_02499 [bacterium HR36]|nr:hypothetical protein HRbin36_02499 [bacterium HR36]